MNQMIAIAPYFCEETSEWVFDDESVGLLREPFVSGVPEMIELLVKDIPDATKGFKLLFSASPFPNYQKKLDWVREEYDGNWYHSKDFNLEGWLCPALFKYFTEAPKEIYIKAEEINKRHDSSNH